MDISVFPFASSQTFLEFNTLKRVPPYCHKFTLRSSCQMVGVHYNCKFDHILTSKAVLNFGTTIMLLNQALISSKMLVHEPCIDKRHLGIS